MPTPSSAPSDSPSPSQSPFHPFTSCPDSEIAETQALDPETSSEAQSHASWRSHTAPTSTTTTTEQTSRPNSSATSETLSATMSPGPQSDEVARDVHMEGIVTARGGDEERHKPADEHMRVAGEHSVQREGGAVGGSTQLTRPTSGEGPSRGKARAEELSPVEGEMQVVDVWESVGQRPRWVEDSGLNGLGLEYSHMRDIPPPPPLYLQTGTKFVGTQQSERQRYDVEVEIKYVDMRESFLCGYLKIQGLTDDHPTLTTYFEGEIIGSRYGFMTQHEGWGASDIVDINHWSKFAAFRPYMKQTRKGGTPTVKDGEQKEHIFMRWKEHFLVPDHRVKTINGASFEGFYYICFNQVLGSISGIYFHSKSERFQQLELKHVDRRGCCGAMEFR